MIGWRRLGLLAVAVWLGLMGLAHGGIANAADLPSLWPELGMPLLLTASAGVVALFVVPSFVIAYRVVAVAAVAGLVMRPLIVAMNYASGFTRSGWAVVIAVLVYPLLAVVFGWWWITRVGPWLGRQQVGATVPGD